jgi:N-acetyl-anhydromuramyl-L-alanine amidase AmpD
VDSSASQPVRRANVPDDRKIVLHITDGKAIDARQTARNVFASPPEAGPDGKLRQQSAHYTVGRDGTVVQCVRHKDVAFHANKKNPNTIGIEHNARDHADTTLTDIQYWKSAQLVVWLGQQLGIPMDRHYVVGHAEIDPTTTHRECPKRALDWDTYMKAIADVQALAQGHVSMRLWDS